MSFKRLPVTIGVILACSLGWAQNQVIRGGSGSRTGTNGVTSGALTGDVTKPNGSAVTTIASGSVTGSKIAAATISSNNIVQGTIGSVLWSAEAIAYIAAKTNGLASVAQLGASTNTTTLGAQGLALKTEVAAATNSNLNGNVVYGGTKTVVFDGSYLWPGDTLPPTWTTNTPGAGSGAIQGAGPTVKCWQISQTAANRWLLQMNMPADWDRGAVNFWINVVSATNTATVNALTNVWAVSGGLVGTALGTVVAVTNNLPIGTGLIRTNFDLASVTIAGSPSPGDPAVIQFESRAGNTPWSSTNNEFLGSVGMRYSVTNIQNNAIAWP